MTVSELRNELEMLFDEMTDDEILEFHDSVCDDYSDEGAIHLLNEDEFERACRYRQIGYLDAIDSLASNFDSRDTYFTIDANGIIYSFNDLMSSVSPWDRDAAIQYIIDFGESYGNPDIQMLLDRYDNEYDGLGTIR